MCCSLRSCPDLGLDSKGAGGGVPPCPLRPQPNPEGGSQGTRNWTGLGRPGGGGHSIGGGPHLPAVGALEFRAAAGRRGLEEAPRKRLLKPSQPFGTVTLRLLGAQPFSCLDPPTHPGSSAAPACPPAAPKLTPSVTPPPKPCHFTSDSVAWGLGWGSLMVTCLQLGVTQ